MGKKNGHSFAGNQRIKTNDASKCLLKTSLSHAYHNMQIR